MLNGELSTANTQLRDRVEELEATNHDMASLLNCTEIAAVFLEPTLRIRRFTAAATELFNLTPTDIGRPIRDILDEMSRSGTARPDRGGIAPGRRCAEKQVQSDEGRWWLRRIVPCRAVNHQVKGVVLTYTEVTEIKVADMRALKERESHLWAISLAPPPTPSSRSTSRA